MKLKDNGVCRIKYILPNAMIVLLLCFCCCLVITFSLLSSYYVFLIVLLLCFPYCLVIIMFSLLSCYYIFQFLIDFVFLQYCTCKFIVLIGTEWQWYRGRLYKARIAYSADKSWKYNRLIQAFNNWTLILSAE